MSTPTVPRSTPRHRRYTTVEVDLAGILDDLDEGELAEYGLHDQAHCPAKIPVAETPDDRAIREAIASLHRQAHPGQHPEPFLCREEPCCSLGTSLLLSRMGRAS